MIDAITQRIRRSVADRPALAGLPRFAPSTRLKILGWYMILLAAALAFGLFLQRTILLNQVDDEINTQLGQEVEELERLTGGRDPDTGQPFGNDVAAIFDTFLRRNIPVEDEAMFALVNGEPHASTVSPVQLFDDDDVVSEWASITSTTRAELDTDSGKVRYLAVPIGSDEGDSGVFVVGIFMDGRRDDVNDVVRTAAFIFGSTFIVASALAWFAAGRVLRPVRLLTDTVRSITDDNWSERIPVEGDDEIAELTETFNSMLDRLEEAFSTQRRFIDDAGHELRTPITIIRGHLEMLESAPDDREETLRIVMDELDRMTRLVDDLLLLARSDQPDFLDLRPVDVGELTEDVVAKARSLAPRDWSVAERADVVMTADGQRLTQALMNLASNAAEHTTDGSSIVVGSWAGNGQVQFWVRDDGAGIPLAEQKTIFERFSRGQGRGRSGDGAGLGLAITRAIVEAHGGTVRLDSTLGAGSTFVLVLPIFGPDQDS